jgi:carboxyl-terminal processing protease
MGVVPCARAGVPRTALVIGNSAYAAAPLRNAVADAGLMAATLRDLGFDVVLLENAGLDRMLETVRRWVVGGTAAESRVFYFAGHGVQSGGRNFLLPVNVAVQSEVELRTRAIDATDLIARMAQMDRGVNLVVLDACRNLPEVLVAGGPRARAAGGATREGLAPLDAPRGTLVAYATSPGAVALDSSVGGHSPYTRHLAEQMRVPGLPVESIFKRVRAAVMEETRRAQVPWETSSLIGEYCLRLDPDGRCSPPVRPSPQRQSLDLRRL